MTPELKILTIRIPADLAVLLEDLAGRERRSVNQQIVVILEFYMKSYNFGPAQPDHGFPNKLK